MARPSKNQRIDYFPHMCGHGKTMFVIEQRYGNDGYAFWFKLLEQLGSKDGHALDIKDPETFEYMQARTKLSADRCTEILDHLAKLHAIDETLWVTKSIIWSQNFVDNIEDVYRKRKTETPRKPGFCDSNPQKPEQGGVSVTETRQSKVKESKEKEMVSVTETQDTDRKPDTTPNDTLGLNAQQIHLLTTLQGIYPTAGLQEGIEDGRIAEIIRRDIHGDFGQVAACVKNYLSAWTDRGADQRFLKQLVNLLDRGSWKNFKELKPTGGSARERLAEKARDPASSDRYAPALEDDEQAELNKTGMPWPVLREKITSGVAVWP